MHTSIFAVSREERGGLLFLREFVKSITLPVVHDGREHIEYVPTQVLTEYFRQQVTTLDGSALDGIVDGVCKERTIWLGIRDDFRNWLIRAA